MNKKIKIEEIKTGDNLLVSTNSWLGRTIQKFQKCKWNHAGKFIVISNVAYVCEAKNRGICLTPFVNYTNNKTKYQLLIQKPKKIFSEEEIQRMQFFMLSKCGNVGYEYVNLLLYQPIKFLTGIWIGSKTDKKGDRRYICGEWVARIDNIIRGWFEKWEDLAPVELFKSEHYKNYELEY